jgi:hypothetical protein
MEAASLKIYTMMHNAYVLYFNAPKCNLIKFSKRKNTFASQISYDFIILYMCDMFKAIKIFKRVYHRQMKGCKE